MSPSKRKAIVFDLEDDKSKKKQRKNTSIQFTDEVKSSDSKSQEFDDLLPLYLQPELMPLSQMLEILGQNNFFSSSLTGKSRADVEKLFLRHISPKHQREYRDNHTGRKLNLLQRKASKKEPNSWCSSFTDNSLKTEATVSKPSVSSPKNSIPNVGERLKPVPASLINTQRKIIKLSSSPVKAENSTNNQKETLKSPENSAKRVKISLDDDKSPAKRAKVSWP